MAIGSSDSVIAYGETTAPFLPFGLEAIDADCTLNQGFGPIEQADVSFSITALAVASPSGLIYRRRVGFNRMGGGKISSVRSTRSNIWAQRACGAPE